MSALREAAALRMREQSNSVRDVSEYVISQTYRAARGSVLTYRPGWSYSR
ncbi:hypothetical protein GCM10010411_47310 [Actinomadura fulvescens]|uniref:Uncharacterized protein n=1 Tax=Actinomadura fulvescens TaxID=46160 RepID=A0ABP6C8B6_9ACTN